MPAILVEDQAPRRESSSNQYGTEFELDEAVGSGEGGLGSREKCVSIELVTLGNYRQQIEMPGRIKQLDAHRLAVEPSNFSAVPGLTPVIPIE